MQFWDNLGPLDLLVVAMLLVVARAVTTGIPMLRRLALPPALVAGAVGMLLGPAFLDVLPVATASLETVVYHCLALLYISMALQAVPRGRVSHGARSITFGIPVIILLQGALGLIFVVGWTSLVEDLHPGFGLMLALGFSQGPGQALALGASWEPTGFVNGGQAGLLMAALGYAWCSVVGVTLFHLGRRAGWHRTGGQSEARTEDRQAAAQRPAPLPGDLDALTSQAALVGFVYLLVWGLLSVVTAQLADEKLVARLWGFHFIFALVLSIGARRLMERVGVRDRVVDDELQSRLSGFIIDAAAVCAIAAVRVDLLADLLAPAVALALLGGTFTTVLALWLCRRAFPERPFAHALMLFGTVTGTLPTGLVLLRLEDPALRTTAARNVIMGMPGVVVLSVPLILVVLPIPVADWPVSYPGAVWLATGICVAYAAALMVAWRFMGALRPVGSAVSIWPTEAHALEAAPEPPG
jgi:ESS family glutamate:Na+ symporter